MQKFDNLLETEQNMTDFVPNCKLIYRTVKNPSLQVIWTIHTFFITVHEGIPPFRSEFYLLSNANSCLAAVCS